MNTEILKKLGIIPNSHLALQLATRSDEELSSIVCGLGHDRLTDMTMAEMKKDDTFNHYYNKGRSYLMESALSMIHSLNS
jgi:hypothetical protein